MEQGLKISYENIGTSSYLTIVLTPDSGLIVYQLEMLAANQISHVLSVTKRMQDEDTMAYYNISSQIPLSQILSRRKLKRKEFITVIKGAIAASRDAKEYQLPMTGFVMEPDYIFVDPSSCEPKFLFLPVSRTGEKGLKELIMDLIMQGRIEMSNDNFVQVLLETINKDPLMLDSLETCLDNFLAQGREAQDSGIYASRKGKNTDISNASPQKEISKGPNGSASRKEASSGYAPAGSAAAEEKSHSVSSEIPVESDHPIASPSDEQEKPPVPPVSGKKRGGKAADKRAKRDEARKKKEKEKDFDSEKAKKKFLLPQAIVMVGLAVAVSFGFFTDATGAIAVNNILAVVLLVAVFEVILYREIYVNSKKDKGEKKNTAKAKMAEEKKGIKPGPKPVPGKKPIPKGAKSAPMPPRDSQPVVQPPAKDALEAEQKPQPEFRQQQAPIPQVQYPQPPAYKSDSGIGDTVLGTETELYDETAGISAYLEYYENGILTRVPLNRPSVLIGRLESQVDFAVSSPRVGKIHAEFIFHDGHYFVKDINSKNGTYINGGERINSNIPYPIHDNDRIRLADREFTLRCSS